MHSAQAPKPLRAILVVDDDVDILRFMRETLTALAMCVVDTTPSPQYAFELALRKRYDLLLFDYQMPLIDGAVLYTFIRQVHDLNLAVPPRPAPPLVLLSGHGEQPGARELLRQPGVRGFLPKPFTIERLLALVEACLPPAPRAFLEQPPR